MRFTFREPIVVYLQMNLVVIDTGSASCKSQDNFHTDCCCFWSLWDQWV